MKLFGTDDGFSTMTAGGLYYRGLLILPPEVFRPRSRNNFDRALDRFGRRYVRGYGHRLKGRPSMTDLANAEALAMRVNVRRALQKETARETPNKHRMTIRLDDETAAEVKRLAQIHFRDESFIVRLALQMFIDLSKRHPLSLGGPQ